MKLPNPFRIKGLLNMSYEHQNNCPFIIEQNKVRKPLIHNYILDIFKHKHYNCQISYCKSHYERLFHVVNVTGTQASKRCILIFKKKSRRKIHVLEITYIKSLWTS